MRITRLQVKDFRRYRDLDIELAPGLTVVRGPNEAGKSTLQRVVEIALTRKVTSTSGDLDAVRPWGSDDDSRPWIRLEFVSEDEDKVRHGSLEKSFRGAKGVTALDIDGETTTDPAEADARIAELTGIPTEPFFRSTASVRHHEMDDLARDESALRDRLQASISGADRGTSAAKKKLDKAMRDLNKAGDKNPGRLKVADEAVKQSAGIVSGGEAALAQLERDRESLAGVRERRAVVDAKLAEDRAMLEKARQAERLIAERATAQERFERYRTAVTVSEELGELATTHPSPNPLPVLTQILERLRVLDGRMTTLRAMLSGEVEVNYEVTAPEPTWRAPAVVAILLILVGLGLVAASQLALKDSPLLLPVGIGLVVLGAVIALFARRQRSLSTDLRAQKQLAGVEIDRRLRGRSQLEQELREAEADTAAQLENLGLPDIASAETLLSAEEGHVAKMNQLSAQLDGLVGKEPAETLAKTRDAAALEVDQKSAALSGLGPIANEPRARERLESEVHDGEGALERARDDEANARARVEANTVDAEQVAGESERLVGWQEQLETLQRRARVYQQTFAAIEQAEQATMKTATRYLEKSMVADIGRITAGRYSQVKVDDRSLDISVFAPERGDWVDVRELSQGTLDQVYLAARLGLVRLVTGDRRPPLVFDDPFVTFDDVRAARSIELLKSLTRDFQVIFLTTSDRYDVVADKVVELCATGGSRSLTVVFGLLSALTWGSADFGGGLAARRAPVFGVVLLSQVVGGALALVLALARAEALPAPADLGWAIAGGVAGSIGITSLYHGLATGRIAVVAPVTGVLAAAIPVAAGWFLQGTPSGLQVIGIGLAIVAVVLVSMSTDPTSDRAAGVRFGLLGGIGFGLFNVFASRFTAGSVFGPLVIVRAFEALSVAVFVVGTHRSWRVPRSVLLLAMAVGVGDMAGNGFFILAAQAGRLDIAGVLSSLYPVTTVVLATLFLHERVTRRHAVGIGLAFGAIVLIAGG